MKTFAQQELYIGKGSYRELKKVLSHMSPKKIFFVTGKKSYSQSSAERLLEPIVKQYAYTRFFDFNVNPQVGDIEKAMNAFSEEDCDVIVAVGGGSVMDLAKAVSILITQPAKFQVLREGKETLDDRQIPTIMIPTTAGTGSESTCYSVVNFDKEKYSISHESLVPDVAILEPAFIKECPNYVAACAGMDALCQAIEGFWSVHSTDESKEYSKKAIELIIPNLVKAVIDKEDEALSNMLLGSNWAGKAITIAQTTISHAASYPMTSYFGVAHGHAVALTLPHLLVLNSEVSEDNLQDSRGVEYIKNTMHELINDLGQDSAQQAREVLLGLMKKIGLQTKLSELNIQQSDIGVIVENGFSPQRAKK